MFLLIGMVIYNTISYLDSFIALLMDLSDVHDDWNNDDVEVNDSSKLDTDNVSVFDRYFDGEATSFLDCWLPE